MSSEDMHDLVKSAGILANRPSLIADNRFEVLVTSLCIDDSFQGRRFRASTNLSIWGVVHIQELVNRPMKPAHEEDPEGKTVGH